VVIEEFLEGEIGSLFALCDGKDSIVFGSAQDDEQRPPVPPVQVGQVQRQFRPDPAGEPVFGPKADRTRIRTAQTPGGCGARWRSSS
jgi:hypothetical protein